MLFNTVTYAYFFTAVFALTWLLRPWRRVRLAVLLISSYIFYAGWTFVGFDVLWAAWKVGDTAAFWAGVLSSCKYIPLLFVATSIDYLLGVLLDRIQRPTPRKLMLIATVLLNVGILIFFKYWNWGADSFVWLMRTVFDTEVGSLQLRVELPIGISFFCFMSLSYVIDVYRRTIPASQSYLSYLTYISFFPHLVAGPIIRGRDLLPHLERDTKLTAETGGEGMFLIAAGLFKKVVIGDYLAVNFVDRVFAEPTSYSAIEAMMAMYGYAVQVYCDFAGYSDVAIGSALLLGYRFKINFDAPFKSTNIVEFWRRWHISLSTWLRDYVYISLGGSRHGSFRKYFNMFITMVICGVWHGAAWTYFVFGCIQGAALSITHWFQGVREKPGGLKKAAAIALFGGGLWALLHWRLTLYEVQLRLTNAAAADNGLLEVVATVQRVSLLVGVLLLGGVIVALVLTAVRAAADAAKVIAAKNGDESFDGEGRVLFFVRRGVTLTVAAAFALVVAFLVQGTVADWLHITVPFTRLAVVALAVALPVAWKYAQVRFSTVFAVFANFTFVGLTFTMFRAASLDRAWGMYERVMSATTYTNNLHRPVLFIMLGALVLQWSPRKMYDGSREWFIRAPAFVQAAVLFVVALTLRAAASAEAVPFVYFQF